MTGSGYKYSLCGVKGWGTRTNYSLCGGKAMTGSGYNYSLCGVKGWN